MAIRTKARNSLQTTENTAGQYLLPDEDVEEFRRFSDAILQDLAPQGTYQRHLATNLVHIEWDQQRHRRLLAAVLQTEFRALAAGVAEMGVPGRASALFSVRSHFDLGRSRLAHDAEGEEVLRKAGVTRSEITAAALLARRETVAYHEARIGDLERRRRQLLADYDRYQARKPLADDTDDAIESSNGHGRADCRKPAQCPEEYWAKDPRWQADVFGECAAAWAAQRVAR